jgi:hypothetical protein
MNNQFNNEMMYIMCLMLPIEIQKVIACTSIMYYKRMKRKTRVLCDSINELNKYINYIDYKSYRISSRHITRASEYNRKKTQSVRISTVISIPNINIVYMYHSDSLSSPKWVFITTLMYITHLDHYNIFANQKCILITKNPIHYRNGHIPTPSEIISELTKPVLLFNVNTLMTNVIEVSSFIQYKLFVDYRPIKVFPETRKYYQSHIGEDNAERLDDLRYYDLNDFRSQYINDLKFTKYRNQYIKKHHKKIKSTIYDVNHEITEYKTALKHTVKS